MPLRETRILVVCLLWSLCVGYYFFGLLLPAAHLGAVARGQAGGYEYGNDFYQIWVTTNKLLKHRVDPYTPEMQREIETGLYGRPLDRSSKRDAIVPYRGYSYPVQANLLLAPLGLMSFSAVQIVLSLVLPFCVAASVIGWSSACGLHFYPYKLASMSVIALGTCPVLEGLYALQPTLMVAAFVAGSLALLRKHKLAWGGIVLSLGSIKPHLIGLLALWLMLWAISDWSRRKAFLISFVAASSFQLLVTELWVPGWWLQWWNVLPLYRRVNSPPLAQLVLGHVAGGVAAVVWLLLALYVAWRWRRRPADSSKFFLACSFMLAVTVILASSSVAVYDQLFLLPAILWIWSERRSVLRANWPVRLAALLLAGAFVWSWLIATLLTLTSPLLPWSRSYAAVLLPLATAASFPLILLGLLTLLLWREIRGSSLHGPQEALQPVPVSQEP